MKGVSVVICCYNSEKLIANTLNHIAHQKVDNTINWEVILVNNNSNDGTVDLAKKTWDKLNVNVPFKIVEEPCPGLNHARIKGAHSSKYDYLLYCDDDVWLSESYVNTVYNVMSSNMDIGVLGGRGEAVSDTPLPYWFSTYQVAYAIGVPALYSGDITHRGYVWGAGFTIRRIIFIKLLQSGFYFACSGRKGNVLMAGDDSEIYKK